MMRQQSHGQPSVADICFEKKKLANAKPHRLDTLINWDPIQQVLRKHYNKGKKAIGRLPHSPLVLFKMMLLQTWKGLRDEAIEDMVKDRMSFIKFCSLRFEDEAPDAASLCQFRGLLVSTGALDQLLQRIKEDLQEQGILVKTSILVDASITDTPRKPKGKKTYELAERKTKTPPKPVLSKGADKDGSWQKKGNTFRYGYKKHFAVAAQTGLILSVLTSGAKDHESRYLPALLKKLKLAKGTPVYTDKGYFGKANDDALNSYGCRNRIQRKTKMNSPLSQSDRIYNTLISKFRYRVEQVFGRILKQPKLIEKSTYKVLTVSTSVNIKIPYGYIKRRFKAGTCRYVGKAKAHSQHVMEAVAYNLYRLDGIVNKGR